MLGVICAECRYAECRYAESRGAVLVSLYTGQEVIFSLLILSC
jgi:hypothetical protein